MLLLLNYILVGRMWYSCNGAPPFQHDASSLPTDEMSEDSEDGAEHSRGEESRGELGGQGEKLLRVQWTLRNTYSTQLRTGTRNFEKKDTIFFVFSFLVFVLLSFYIRVK